MQAVRDKREPYGQSQEPSGDRDWLWARRTSRKWKICCLPLKLLEKRAGHNAGSDLRLAKIGKWKGLTTSGRWKETCCHFVWLSAGGRAAYNQDGLACSWAWVYSEIFCTLLLQVWVVLAWSNGVVFVLRRRDGSSQGPAVRLFLWTPGHPAPWGQALGHSSAAWQAERANRCAWSCQRATFEN